MSKTDFMNKVTRTFGRAGLHIKKHSPEILLVTGIAGVVTSAVMACKATTKVDFILEDTKDKIDHLNACKESGQCLAETDDGIREVEYTEQDHKKDLAIVYGKAGLEFVKLYGPSVALGIASIGCILASNGIMRKRNVALAAAYAAADKSLKGYRSRVVERFGEELDRELMYNIKAKEVEEVVVDENGEKKVVKKTVNVADPNLCYSPYSIVFDCGNTGWDKDPEVTKYFLVQQQNYANDILQSRGHLFLNEVYDMLGAKRTKMGQYVGWYYDEKHPVGDNFVDFGIFNVNNPKACEFVNGDEKAIILDFNVDGDIQGFL